MILRLGEIPVYLEKAVVDHNQEVVGLSGFADRKITDPMFGRVGKNKQK